MSFTAPLRYACLAFFSVSLLAAVSGESTLIPNTCRSEVLLDEPGEYLLMCPDNTTCSVSCDPFDSQVGSTHYHYCACEDDTSEECNGWVKSNSADPSDPGTDVGCFTPADCGTGWYCDELQLPEPPQLEAVPICGCKPL